MLAGPVAMCALGSVLAGCATDAVADSPAQRVGPAEKPRAVSAPNATAHSSAAEPGALLAAFAGGPRPERQGVHAPVVWNRVPAVTSPLCSKGQEMSRLEVAEIRADAAAVYVDVFHVQPGPPASWPLATQAPNVQLDLDGCAAASPAFSGVVWQDSKRYGTPSTLTFALANLPDGELDLTLGAFGVSELVPLKKRGSSVSYLREDQRAGCQLVPGDPSRNLSPGVIVPEADCTGRTP